MKVQEAEMKENESPKDQKLQNAAGLAADEICLNLIRKRAVFGNLWRGTSRGSPGKQKMKGNENPKGQNKMEMKAQKAKTKRNKGPKGQNKRKLKLKRPK